MEKTAFEVACEKAGGLVALANSIGKAKQTVNHYKGRVPTDACPLIEQATGVTCEALRPDIRWVRVPDESWPNGKPLIDTTRPTERAAARSLDQSQADAITHGAAAPAGGRREGPSNHRERGGR